MAPTIVDMAAELEGSPSPIVTHTIEASPRLHTIEAVTVELADVTIDAAIDAAMFEPPLAHTVAHALNPHLAHTVAPPLASLQIQGHSGGRRATTPSTCSLWLA